MILLSGAESRLLNEHLSRKDVVLKLLRSAILDGRLASGQRLDQNELAASFNVSRMPVREALKQLESEGLVVVYPYRGVEVAKLDVSEVHDLFAIRGALERLAVRHAIETIDEPALLKMQDVLKEMDKLVESDVADDCWAEHNRTFHETINSASGMHRLCEAIAVYRDKVDRYLRRYFSMGGRVRSQSEHWAIYEALKLRDGERAERLVEQHANSTAELLVAAIEEAHADLKLKAAEKR